MEQRCEFCVIASDVQILISYGLGLEPQFNGACDGDEEETLSLENNQSQSGSLSSSINGPLAETESVVEAGDGQFLLSAEVLSGELEDKDNQRSEQTPAGWHISTSGFRGACVFVCMCLTVPLSV